MSILDRGTMKPLIVALDLEFNQPSRKLIQIGAVVGDLTTGRVVDRFSAFANPSEQIALRIKLLTGIKQSDVDAAPDIRVAYRQLVTWMKPYLGQLQPNPLTWGGGDSEDLREAVRLDREDKGWCFGRRWTDAKTVFYSWRAANNRPGAGSLARSMTKLGLAFHGRRHNAQDDAENTFRIYFALLRQFQPELVPGPEQSKTSARHRAP